MKTTTRYRAPSVDATVSLDEFSDKAISEYMAERRRQCNWDPQVDTDGGVFLDPDVIACIDTLVLCGLKQEARDELAEIVGKAIGRPL